LFCSPKETGDRRGAVKKKDPNNMRRKKVKKSELSRRQMYGREQGIKVEKLSRNQGYQQKLSQKANSDFFGKA